MPDRNFVKHSGLMGDGQGNIWLEKYGRRCVFAGAANADVIGVVGRTAVNRLMRCSCVFMVFLDDVMQQPLSEHNYQIAGNLQVVIVITCPK